KERLQQGIGGSGQRTASPQRARGRHLLRHIQAAIGGKSGGDGLTQADGRRVAAGRNEVHVSSIEKRERPAHASVAAGESSDDTQPWLSKPAAAKAACTGAIATSAASRVSNHAKMLGPAPEMLPPIAPAASTACLAASKPAI